MLVELKIAFSKYDYFGILIPGFLFLTCFFILIPEVIKILIGEMINFLPGLQLSSIFVFSISILVIAYITGLILSGLSRWAIEDFLIKKRMGYPSESLFKTNKTGGITGKKLDLLGDEKRNRQLTIFKKYKVPYSDEFRNEFEKEFIRFFNNKRFTMEDKFKLCFNVIKEASPITFGRLSTFIALYGLYRTLSLAFLILTIFVLIRLVFYINLLMFFLLISFPLLSMFCFTNYLKFLKAYSDEVFRSFYIHAFKSNQGASKSV